MPMGTDTHDSTPPADPRDAELAALRAQVAAQNTTPAPVAEPVDPRDAEIAELKAQLTTQPTVPATATVTASQGTAVEDPRDAIIRDLQNKLAAATAPAPAESDVDRTDPDWIEQNFTHYVHLADGQVKKMVGTVTHYFDEEGNNIPVIGTYLKS
jgi:hypothetical protein